MPIDVSMYNQGQNSLQPVDIASKYASLQSAINQNKLFPGQMQLQHQSIMQGAQGVEQNKIAIDAARMEYMNKQANVLHQGLGSLADDPNLTPDKVAKFGQMMVDQKVITPEMFSVAMKNMPTDPGQLKPYLGQILKSSLISTEKANMVFGTPSLVNTGQGLKPVSISPTQGVRDIPGKTIRVMPSESEMNQPAVIGRDERGRPIQGTQRQFLQRATGVDPITQQPVQSEGADQVASLGNTPIPQQPPNQGQVQGGGIVTSLAPGEGETMQQSAKAWQEARQYVAGDNATPNGSSQRLMTLGKALQGLQGAAETGPGSETYNQVRSFIQTLSPTIGEMVGIDPEQIASYDEANKYLIANASQAAGAMGSDSRLASALSGNANTHISNLAAQDVVKANIALERAKMAQVSLFQSLGGRPEEFSDWAAEVNRKIDPRAFAVDLMDTEKRKKMFASMSPTDKKKFLESVRVGIQTGVIDQGSLGGNNGQ